MAARSDGLSDLLLLLFLYNTTTKKSMLLKQQANNDNTCAGNLDGGSSDWETEKDGVSGTPGELCAVDVSEILGH
ncbi:hypothetical protein BHE74_00048517 [Ensete ventricosum]|nr:hypothetical protein BHE74_00048517 [Ensete ventricosum]RZS05257.1 hypothetical protein BHM03_00035742 [Ensete ventricosum]